MSGSWLRRWYSWLRCCTYQVASRSTMVPAKTLAAAPLWVVGSQLLSDCWPISGMEWIRRWSEDVNDDMFKDSSGCWASSCSSCMWRSFCSNDLCLRGSKSPRASFLLDQTSLNQSSLEYSDSLRLQPALQVLNSSLSFLVLLGLLQDTKLGNFTIEKRRIT